MNDNRIALSYDDVCLVPKYCTTYSRTYISTDAKFGELYYLPVVPANMKCVINEDIAQFLRGHGYFYIMHRFGDTLGFVRKANSQGWDTISISIGVKDDDYKLIDEIYNEGLRVTHITVDVAHGHHSLVRDILAHIKGYQDTNWLPDLKIIGGNIATPDAFHDLVIWGCDAVKVGIGGGKSCTTKYKTGFTMPMFSCIREIADYRQTLSSESQKVKIIADGGIRHNGDIVKALVAGADWVMSGALFAECVDSPAPDVLTEHGTKKSYFGSASYHNKGHSNNIEGTLILCDSNGMTYEQKMEEIKQDIQSGCSYAGVDSVDKLYRAVEIRTVNN